MLLFRKILAPTVLFFGLLGLVAWLAWQFQPADKRSLDAVYVFVALVPFLFYLFATDKLAQFKGPGGIELVLRSQADKKITGTVSDKAIEFTAAQVITKGGVSLLQRTHQQNPPNTLAFVTGEENRYDADAIQAYLDELSTALSFRWILFRQKDGDFQGCMTVDDFEAFFSRSDDIAAAISSGSILLDKHVVRGSLLATATQREALQKMDALGTDVLAVVDADKRFQGTITQDEIVRKMLSKALSGI